MGKISSPSNVHTMFQFGFQQQLDVCNSLLQNTLLETGPFQVFQSEVLFSRFLYTTLPQYYL